MEGDTVGPYQVLARIGAGGMGEVFLGHDPRLQRRVALKCLTGAQTQTAEGRARILREARAAARLKHANIAPVYDVLEQDGRTFIVMELVEGESLAARFARGRLPAGDVRKLGEQLASALAAAHEHGVIHRDLKPANIHFTADGSIKVLDFGVARVSMTEEPAPGTTTEGAGDDVTLAGNPGTPVYMSPEQLFSRPVDARSDIYSAGVVLFEAATGRKPYLERGAVALALAMTSGPPPAAASINPEIPPDLSSAIDCALQVDPDRRFQTARALASALAPAGVGSNKQTSRSDDESRAFRWKRSWRIAAGALAFIAFGVAVQSSLRVAIFPDAARSTIAVLPATNSTHDAAAEHLGLQLMSIVTANLGAVPNVSVLSRTKTIAYAERRQDAAALLRSALGATHVIDVVVSSAAPADAVVRIRRTGDGRLLEDRRHQGTAAEVESGVLTGIRDALTRDGVWPSAWPPQSAARFTRIPTTRPEALDRYLAGRALLDRTDLAANVTEAIDAFAAAAAADPGFAGAHAALAIALVTSYRTDRNAALLDRASVEANTALRLDPGSAEAHVAFAATQNALGRRDAAVTAARRAIDLDPASHEAHRTLGALLVAHGKVDAGIAELHEAIRLHPDFDSYLRLGSAHYAEGRFRDAADAYQRATELQPDTADGFLNLGAAYYFLGDTERAVGYYEHALRVGGGNPLAYGNLAVAYLATGRIAQALEACLAAVKMDPKRASLHRDLGDIYKKLERTREANRAYETAIALARQSLAADSKDARAVMLIALSEAGMGRRIAAERHAAEAVALAPQDRELIFRSVKVYAAVGNTPTALARLKSAVAMGYHAERARLDPDLSGLRNVSGFSDAIDAGVRERPRTAAQ